MFNFFFSGLRFVRVETGGRGDWQKMPKKEIQKDIYES
jgi:hypothetical protein